MNKRLHQDSSGQNAFGQSANDRHAIIGVIGGMGPEATVEFMRRVIDATPAEDDVDHIHLLVDNNPKVPSRIKALIEGNGESPGATLAAMARRLEDAGADFLVMPCNTAHYYWDYAQDAVSVPVANIVELTLKAVQAAMPGARIGMLASPALRKIGLYERHAAEYDMELLYLDDETPLLEVIRAVKGGRGADSETIEAFNRSAHELQEKGATILVLACTELSVIKEDLKMALAIVDSLQVLVDEVVAFSSSVSTNGIEPS